MVIYSGLSALFITAAILLFANVASAENATTSPGAVMKRNAVEAARSAMPSEIEAKRKAAQQNLIEGKTATTTRMNEFDTRVAEKKATWDQLRAEWQAKVETRRSELAQKQAEWQEKFAARKSELEQKRAEMASSTAARKAALKDAVQAKVKERAIRIANVLTKAIDKIDGLRTRLATRAETLETQGIDMTEVNALLEEVRTTLLSAKEALKGIDVNIEYTVTSGDPKADWADTREQFEQVRDLIKTAHELLREALAAMKDAVGAAREKKPAEESTPDDSSAE